MHASRRDTAASGEILVANSDCASQWSARGHYLPLIKPELAIFSFIFLDHTRGKEGLSVVGKGQYGYKEVISGGKKGLSGVEDG